MSKYLYENNKDIYGNDVDVKFYDDNSISAKTKNIKNEFPIYLVELTTAKSNKFRKIIGIGNINNWKAAHIVYFHKQNFSSLLSVVRNKLMDISD